MAESSSALPNTDKPVIVRVKRKAFQSPLDAFWLEINERPLKRALHDFEKLSISNASSSRGPELHGQQQLLDFEKLSLSNASSDRVKEFRKKKILVRHVKTVSSSKDTFDVLQTFKNIIMVQPNSSVKLNSEEKYERRMSLKTMHKQDSLQVQVRQRQEILSRHARFEQIWRSRKAMEEAPEEEAIYDMCKLYDVVRVDVVEENTVEVQSDKDRDCKMMAEYLPLLRDVLPAAAEEIESDIQNVMAKQASADGFVYDFYAIKEDDDEMDADSTSKFALIQVDDDDFYDGPDDSEYETDDSNGENNPMNDYPDEEMSEDEDEEDEDTSRSSEEESEGESRTSRTESEEEEMETELSYEYDDEDSIVYEWSANAHRSFKDDAYSDGDDESYM